MAAPGTDIVLSDDRLLGARSFANKIWNAARFLFVNLDKLEQNGIAIEDIAAPEFRERLLTDHEWTDPASSTDGSLHEWLRPYETVNDALSNYRFHEAAQAVYQFFWGDFCDWYIKWA